MINELYDPFDWCYGIVNGVLKKIKKRSMITYRAEDEDSQFIIEGYCAKQVLKKIQCNYSNIVFKIYQVKNFEKSDKFYYVINGELFNYSLDNFILVEIPKIEKTFTLFNIDDLPKIMTIFPNEKLRISVFENGVLSSVKKMKGGVV